jgi:hypothetical protein
MLPISVLQSDQQDTGGTAQGQVYRSNPMSDTPIIDPRTCKERQDAALAALQETAALLVAALEEIVAALEDVHARVAALEALRTYHIVSQDAAEKVAP